MTARQLLQDLTGIQAASGYEQRVHDYLRARLAPLVDRMEADGAGNLVAFRDGPSSHPLLLVAAHVDQVALYVRRAIPGGYLRLRAPAIDLRCLPGLPVDVDGLPGVVGMLPPHLRRRADRDKPLQEEDLYIDLGSAREEDLPGAGTPAYFRVAPRTLGEGRFSAPGLDNRASVAALCLALEALQGHDLGVRLAFAFTASEEIGRAGAAYLGAGLAPDLALAVDVTFAQQPEVAVRDSLMEFGRGPAIGVGPNVAPPVEALLQRTADAAGIPTQREPLPGDSGTDGWALQIGGLGIPTGVVSIPLTSMHSPAEVVAIADVEHTAALLSALAASGFPREDLRWD